MLLGRRERELIERIGPVLMRRFDDLVAEWRAGWVVSTDEAPPLDLPAVTRTAIEDGVEAALEAQRRAAQRLVREGVDVERVVRAVLLWEEVVLRRLARDAVEDIFSGAAAINRLLHHVVLYCAQGYTEALREERDGIRRTLQEADRMKSELISMISHDLKTPLTTVQACAVAMLEAPDIEDAQRKRFLEMILQNAERLSRLISRIVDVSRIEARAVDLSIQPLDLGAVARRLVESILPMATVHLEVAPGLGPVMADREALERILVNLIDNAVRFSPEGQAVLVSVVAEGREAEVRVVDRGPGIPEERRSGLFSKFYQVESAETGQRKGSGLGLAIVRGLAEAMGGSAGYRPNSGGGSVFWFRVPLAAGAEIQEAG